MSAKKGSKDEKGQATILIGMMMTTFILFFAFVINVGMLVNAKINLQNAADLAAYSGAAVQARQLNQISFLNYEMRRHWKRFLFRYYVLGNLAQEKFPRESGGTDEYDFSPNGNPSNAFKLPVVCLPFNTDNNICQITDIKNVSTSSIRNQQKIGLFNKTLADQMGAIEALKRASCATTSMANQQIILLWLFNFDPDFANTNSIDVSTRKTFESLKKVTLGLGLIPRLALTRQRIQTLTDFINQPAQTVNRQKAEALVNGGVNTPMNERTIQAFLSAYRTLGTYTFRNSDSIKFTELLPGSDSAANLLKLKDIKISEFDIYSLNLDSPTNSNDSTSCTGKPFPFTVSNVVVGVEKDPSVLTYYAVKLQAKAKIIFSPWGDLEMTAYAAARPFGSRIGPIGLSEKDFVKDGLFNPDYCNQSGAKCSKKIPNLALLAGENTDQGWLVKNPLFAFYSSIADDSATMSQLKNISIENIMEGQQSATAPNPWEIGKYNIPHDLANPSGPIFEKFFDPDGYAAFWAPLIPPTVTSEEEIAKQFDPIIDNLKNQVGTTISNNATDLTKFKDVVKGQLREYLETLKKGQGENGESLHVARISNPAYRLPKPGSAGAAGQRLSIQEKLPVPELVLHPEKDRTKIRTSWNGVKDKTFADQNRVGYSIKFISFNSIPKTLTDGSAPPSNSNFSGGDADVSKLQH